VRQFASRITLMASLSLITPPVLEPISVQEAKEHCRVDLTDEDALIDGYVQAARMHIETISSGQCGWMAGPAGLMCRSRR
jgi:hypothetical protein